MSQNIYNPAQEFANHFGAYPVKSGNKIFSQEDGSGLQWALYNFPISRDEAQCFSHYSGPGGSFARASVRRTKRRSLILIRYGYDI